MWLTSTTPTRPYKALGLVTSIAVGGRVRHIRLGLLSSRPKLLPLLCYPATIHMTAILPHGSLVSTLSLRVHSLHCDQSVPIEM